MSDIVASVRFPRPLWAGLKAEVGDKGMSEFIRRAMTAQAKREKFNQDLVTALESFNYERAKRKATSEMEAA